MRQALFVCVVRSVVGSHKRLQIKPALAAQILEYLSIAT